MQGAQVPFGAWIEATEQGGDAPAALLRRAHELGAGVKPGAYEALARELKGGARVEEPADSGLEEALRFERAAAAAAGGGGADEDGDETEPDAEPDSDEGGDEEPVAAKKPTGPALSRDDGAFAYQELRRAGFSEEEAAEFVEGRPERALALARQFKQTRDAHLRVASQAAPGQKPSKPSKTDPSDAAGGPPGEDPSDEELFEALADRFGEDEARALLAKLKPAGDQSQPRASGVDLDAVQAEAERVRQVLVARGGGELADEATWTQVLLAAAQLERRAREGGQPIRVEAAIRGAWSVVQKLAKPSNPKQQVRVPTDSTPHVPVRRRQGPAKMTRDDALVAYTAALEAGRRKEATRLRDTYRL